MESAFYFLFFPLIWRHRTVRHLPCTILRPPVIGDWFLPSLMLIKGNHAQIVGFTPFPPSFPIPQTIRCKSRLWTRDTKFVLHSMIRHVYTCDVLVKIMKSKDSSSRDCSLHPLSSSSLSSVWPHFPGSASFVRMSSCGCLATVRGAGHSMPCCCCCC